MTLDAARIAAAAQATSGPPCSWRALSDQMSRTLLGSSGLFASICNHQVRPHVHERSMICARRQKMLDHGVMWGCAANLPTLLRHFCRWRMYLRNRARSAVSRSYRSRSKLRARRPDCCHDVNSRCQAQHRVWVSIHQPYRRGWRACNVLRRPTQVCLQTMPTVMFR